MKVGAQLTIQSHLCKLQSFPLGAGTESIQSVSGVLTSMAAAVPARLRDSIGSANALARIVARPPSHILIDYRQYEEMDIGEG
jgi:hypothetical protein